MSSAGPGSLAPHAHRRSNLLNMEGSRSSTSGSTSSSRKDLLVPFRSTSDISVPGPLRPNQTKKHSSRRNYSLSQTPALDIFEIAEEASFTCLSELYQSSGTTAKFQRLAGTTVGKQSYSHYESDPSVQSKSNPSVTSKSKSNSKIVNMPQYTNLISTEQWTAHESYLDEYHEAVISSSPRTSLSQNLGGPSVHKPVLVTGTSYVSQSSIDTQRSAKSKKSWYSTRKPSKNPSFSDLKRRRTQRKESFEASSSSSAMLPPVHYYRDPEARDLLKTYLASSTKFDEVLEFGFPTDLYALAEDYPQRVVPARSRIHTANSDADLFLRHGSLSFLSDSEDSGEESTTEEDNSSSSPTFSSVGSTTTTTRSASLNFKPWGMGFGGPSGDRQMTLRITLTRPELRAPDEEIYGAQYTNPEDEIEPEDWNAAEEIGPDLFALPSLQELEQDLLGVADAPPGPNITESRKSKSLWTKLSRSAMRAR